MLSVYRRHKANCKRRKDRGSRKCECPLWAKGTVEGRPFQKTLKTRNWERAETIVRNIERGEIPKEQPKEKPKGITIQDALDAFTRDCQTRNLNPSTRRKYGALQRRILDFGSARGLDGCQDFTTDHLRAFRDTWHLAPRTASKELERLRAFFKFCVENEWITKNPAKAIKAPEIKQNPTLPFTDQELNRIFETARADPRVHTFFKVLLHSGLRVIDAAQLRPEKIQDGKLFLYAQKTGVPVRIPLPPDLLEDLAKLPLVGGFYFAVESDNPVTVAEYYRVKLTKCAIAAGLMTKKEKGTPRRKNKIHPHRFRDSFAVRLLEKGVPLETVSILLGHTDLKITQRSYAPWVKSLQDNLEKAVAQTWHKPKLVRVK